MTRILIPVMTAVLVTSLAACEPAPAPEAAPPAMTAPATDQMPVSSDGPPFITSMSPDVSDAAIAACTAELDAETDGEISVEGGETSEAATAVYMRVGANGAPWRCLVSPDGTNASLMFMGSEGSL